MLLSVKKVVVRIIIIIATITKIYNNNNNNSYNNRKSNNNKNICLKSYEHKLPNLKWGNLLHGKNKALNIFPKLWQ